MNKQKTLDILSNGDMDGIYFGLDGLKKFNGSKTKHLETLGIIQLLPTLVPQAYEYMVRCKFTSSDKYEERTEECLKEIVRRETNELKKLAKRNGINFGRQYSELYCSEKSKSLIDYVKRWCCKGVWYKSNKSQETKIERESNNISARIYGPKNEMHGKFIMAGPKLRKGGIEIILDTGCSDHWEILDEHRDLFKRKVNIYGGGYMYIGNKKILVHQSSGQFGYEPRIVTALALMKLFPDYDLVIKP